MTPSPAAFTLIKTWEGLSLRAYKPIRTEKYFTIGYGHCDRFVGKRDVITLKYAEELLESDVATYSGKLAEQCPRLAQSEFDALISLIYNIGWYAFRHSMTYQTCTWIRKQYEPIECARRILLWVRSGDTILPGLQRRRVAEANHFMGREVFCLKDGRIKEYPQP